MLMLPPELASILPTLCIPHRASGLPCITDPAILPQSIGDLKGAIQDLARLSLNVQLSMSCLAAAVRCTRWFVLSSHIDPMVAALLIFLPPLPSLPLPPPHIAAMLVCSLYLPPLFLNFYDSPQRCRCCLPYHYSSGLGCNYLPPEEPHCALRPPGGLGEKCHRRHVCMPAPCIASHAPGPLRFHSANFCPLFRIISQSLLIIQPSLDLDFHL